MAVAFAGLLTVALASCSSFQLTDCPDSEVLGIDKPRIRSASVRMLLADEAGAAARFADAAVMSAYAYVEEQDCGNTAKVSAQTAAEFESTLRISGWERARDAEFVPGCEDETGLFYHVWKRDSAGSTEVVIAFRGTWGFKDWWYGNLYWFRRFFTDNHQYSRARAHARKIVHYFEGRGSGKTLRFHTAGHSLGGGLAQAVLYELPQTFIQAFVFAPSSATAYTTRSDQTPLTPCTCNDQTLEPRIYRVYESYEILATLRIFHKFIFPPDPWINEVRFSYADGSNAVAQHSMAKLAQKLVEKRSSSPAGSHATPWYSGAGAGCTAQFQKSLERACDRTCAVPVTQRQ